MLSTTPLYKDEVIIPYIVSLLLKIWIRDSNDMVIQGLQTVSNNVYYQ